MLKLIYQYETKITSLNLQRQQKIQTRPNIIQKKIDRRWNSITRHVNIKQKAKYEDLTSLKSKSKEI